MMQNNKKKLPLLVGALLLSMALLASGLVACKDNTQKPEMSDKERIMSLMEKSFFFEAAPEDLYFGEAIEESFTDQEVTLKYLGAFSDGEGIYLFVDIIDQAGIFFGEKDTPYNASINEYDFFEKAGYTDSRVYDVLDYNTEENTVTVCFEYIGLLEEDNISFHIYSMGGDVSGTRPALAGDWEIKFAITDSLVKTLEANKSLTYKGYDFLVKRAVISPVKITLFAAREDVPDEIMGIQPKDLDIKLVYKNGESLGILGDSGYAHVNQKGYMFRIIHTAKDYQDIVGLEVDGVVFPVAE
jgi:hypothetical protein